MAAGGKSAEANILIRTGFIESERGYLGLTPEASFVTDEIMLKLL